MKNVLLITCDTWRADCLGCADHPLVRTPNLDRLAADGVRFANHFCQATPCGPSRASLYCGMYQLNTRVISNGAPLAARHTNIAEELRHGGYDPVLSGYTHTITEQPASEGMEEVLPGLRSLNTDLGGSVNHLASSWVQWLEELGYDVPADMRFAKVGANGAVLGGDPTTLVGEGAFQHALGADGLPVAAFYKPEHGDTAFAVNQVLAHIREQQKGSNAPGWTCHLSAYKPHPPWLATAPYNAQYLPADAGLPQYRRPSIAEEGSLHPWLAHRLQLRSSVAPEADDDLRLLRSQYFAVCEETDAQLGRLFDELRASGAYDDTLIVMTTDHGEQLGDHWLMNKDGFFDQSYHIPLIIKCPARTNARRGAVVEQFTEHVDILPTILQCLGLPVPAQADGSSLLPFLFEGSEDQEWAPPEGWRSAAHFEFDYSERNPPPGVHASQCSLCVLRGARWKYVQFADERMPALLFDIAHDPGELVNLGTSSVLEHVKAKADCAAQMLQWRMRHAEHTLTHTEAKGLLFLEPKL